MGAVTAALLLAGGLQAPQQATIAIALPFVVVMLVLAASLMRELARDPAAGARPRRARPHGLGEAVGTVRPENGP